jgi:oxygen-independent coproporphyrinogen-3 oxidase
VRTALRWQPEELFVYPLYVRPQTRLFAEFREDSADDLSLVARDCLLEHGYRAVSRRMYVAPGHSDCEADDYRCQVDPMLGLGCGARSYTRALHYSEPFAVGAAGVKRIIRDYCAREDFTVAQWGYALDEDEQARRHAVLSLLSHDGLEEAGRFQGLVDELAAAGLVEGPPWRLTEAGRAGADVIGPRFFSERVLACLS